MGGKRRPMRKTKHFSSVTTQQGEVAAGEVVEEMVEVAGKVAAKEPRPARMNAGTKTTGSANAAAESDSDGNGVWAMDTDSDLDSPRPVFGNTLQAFEDSDDDDDVSSFDGASVSDGS